MQYGYYYFIFCSHKERSVSVSDDFYCHMDRAFEAEPSPCEQLQPEDLEVVDIDLPTSMFTHHSAQGASYSAVGDAQQHQPINLGLRAMSQFYLDSTVQMKLFCDTYFIIKYLNLFNRSVKSWSQYRYFSYICDLPISACKLCKHRRNATPALHSIVILGTWSHKFCYHCSCHSQCRE